MMSPRSVGFFPCLFAAAVLQTACGGTGTDGALPDAPDWPGDAAPNGTGGYGGYNDPDGQAAKGMSDATKDSGGMGVGGEGGHAGDPAVSSGGDSSVEGAAGLGASGGAPDAGGSLTSMDGGLGGSAGTAIGAGGGAGAGRGGAAGASGGGGRTDGGDGGGHAPSNPNATCQARNLLEYLYNIKGAKILSGQESMFSDGSFPSSRDKYIYERTRKYPALYSSDFGDVATANLGDRVRVVSNAIAYSEKGSVIQLHYHMVQPDQPDGSGLNVMRGFSEDKPYTATNIDRMLTTGDPFNTELLKRLDEIAGYLKQLQSKGIAVLWRPYHQMNGSWFWWGQQTKFKELWIQMWQRFKEQGVNNALWVFSVNYWEDTWGAKQNPQLYYPGDQYVDVVGVDVYRTSGHKYDKRIHDALHTLGSGKPLGVTENGEIPDVPSLKPDQPNFVYWATWGGYETSDTSKGNNTDALYERVYSDTRTITQDDVDIAGCN